MRKFGMSRILATVIAVVCLVALMSVSAFAATADLVKAGAFTGGGFVNAGEVKDGTITGPGNWTQINCGDAPVELPYLHIIVKCTGDTAKAQIAVSDLFTFNLADLGITLTEEYQDVVLPVQEKDIPMISWVNLMGLDGGSTVYTVKDIFLSDSNKSTLDAAAAPVAAPTEETPKTGSSDVLAIVLFVAMIGSAAVYFGFNKKSSSVKS